MYALLIANVVPQVTKADYREVTEREDYEDIRRFQDLQNKVFERIATRSAHLIGIGIIIIIVYCTVVQPPWTSIFYN